MNGDGLVRLGLTAVVVAVALSYVADELPPGAQAREAVDGPGIGFLLVVTVFAIIGWRWIARRRSRKPPPPRSWARRRRALPPAPQPERPPEE